MHSAHVTNLHTHGLHVAPGMNDNGTSSDDIFLRIVPAADATRISQSPELYREYQEDRDEIVDNVADLEFRLGNVMQASWARTASLSAVYPILQGHIVGITLTLTRTAPPRTRWPVGWPAS